MEAKSQTTTFLVVDDERACRQAVADVLHSRGYAVLKADSAAEALEVLEVVTPELIILDAMMPDVDGLTPLQQLAAQPRFLGVPMVMASAKAMPADRWSAWERGASAYLAKPFTFEEITSLVEHLLAPMEEGCAAPELADRLAVEQGGPHRLSRPSAVCSRARVNLDPNGPSRAHLSWDSLPPGAPCSLRARFIDNSYRRLPGSVRYNPRQACSDGHV